MRHSLRHGLLCITYNRAMAHYVTVRAGSERSGNQETSGTVAKLATRRALLPQAAY